MMAINNETQRPADSSWFKKMEKNAQKWDEFAKRNSFSSEGSYSPYFVQFTLTSGFNTIHIQGKRILSTNGDANYHDGGE